MSSCNENVDIALQMKIARCQKLQQRILDSNFHAVVDGIIEPDSIVSHEWTGLYDHNGLKMYREKIDSYTLMGRLGRIEASLRRLENKLNSWEVPVDEKM